MPRIRTIKPEFFRSPSTAKASFPARILYEAMWCWADDYGIGETNVYGLLGFAFCDEDQITVSELQSLLKEVANAYDVTFYEVEKRHYFAVPSWTTTRRRSGRRGPESDPSDPRSSLDLRFHGSAETAQQTQGNSVRTQGDSLRGTGEQGNRGTGETPSGASELAPTEAPAAAPEQTATANAYERVGKAFNFMAVRGIAKWAIQTRETDPQVVEDALVAIYEMGKPITKQLVGQYLDGHLGRPVRAGASRADEKVQNYLDSPRRIANQQKELA
ncbi:hypothetical protein GS931_21585 [Rhodococcus hoagii]|nr:hypothetical protein [Prescottella equi]